MSLASLIKTGIATANSVTSSLQVDVIHWPWIGQDAKGAPEYASPVTYLALVERKQKRVTGQNGQEVTATYSVTFIQPLSAQGTEGRHEPIDMRDKLILPDGSKVDVLDVSGLVDPDSGLPYMLEVWTS